MTTTLPEPTHELDAMLHHNSLDGSNPGLAESLRRPLLRAAVATGTCTRLDPSTFRDADPFFRAEGESTESWHSRRQDTIKSLCRSCPVAAACEELTLRDRNYDGVRGGLTEDELRSRARQQSKRLTAARTADTHLANQEEEILRAYRHLNRACAVNSDRYKASAPKRMAAVAAARSNVHRLRTARRQENGWAAA
ncbi:WhiB family transcriptional regulator [Kitasatospora sp. NPDC056783]|uniref:WhiB family transcriptional regulator n=1 Tax=Kitasatospora sp. NPDC056783 TaxID=3345943 RepID=UPI0036A55A1A